MGNDKFYRYEWNEHFKYSSFEQLYRCDLFEEYLLQLLLAPQLKPYNVFTPR